MHNYLADIRRARSLPRLGLLIRAFGCHTVAGSALALGPSKAAQEICKYDNQAHLVEHAASLHEARRMLREWGYFK